MRIIQPNSDVYSQVHEAHDEDLSHVIELFDFPSSFKTEDLFTGKLIIGLQYFLDYDFFFAALSVTGKPPDFSVKWVDDTHALAIYGSAYAGIIAC